jgi:hypothetical protein
MVIKIADATGVNRCPSPANAPNAKITSKAADVVASRDRSTNKLRAFAKMTLRKTPTEETTAICGPNKAAMVPSNAVSAKVRIPRSLFDHSLSIPTRSPMPNDTAILAATSDGGKRSTNIDAQLLTHVQMQYTLD